MLYPKVQNICIKCCPHTLEFKIELNSTWENSYVKLNNKCESFMN